MKQIALAGIVAMIAIVTMVLVVQSSLTAQVIGADDFYTQPSGMQMRLESGVVVLQSDVVTNSPCKNAVFCQNAAQYVCCRHDGTSCVLPEDGNRASGSCPLTHRNRCQCREDYIAGLVERYG
jgi:hypothetical protein